MIVDSATVPTSYRGYVADLEELYRGVQLVRFRVHLACGSRSRPRHGTVLQTGYFGPDAHPGAVCAKALRLASRNRGGVHRQASQPARPDQEQDRSGPQGRTRNPGGAGRWFYGWDGVPPRAAPGGGVSAALDTSIELRSYLGLFTRTRLRNSWNELGASTSMSAHVNQALAIAWCGRKHDVSCGHSFRFMLIFGRLQCTSVRQLRPRTLP